MNKDVVYIEPEDDITDIISKIENSKQKIVALVPPKKAGILRSLVNIKLIAKAGANAKKTVVLVTVDPSIVKLAAASKLPVTKDLQTPPTVPHDKPEIDETATEKVEDEEEKDDEKDDKKMEEAEAETEAEGEAEDDEKSDEKGKKKAKKEKKDKKEKKLPNNPVLAWIVSHKGLVIGLTVGLILLILFLIWALVFAPAVTISVVRRTTESNFSENVTFTDKLAEENASEGKFYLEQKTNENKIKRDIEATGKKNVGEYAHGEVVVYAYFKQSGTIAINAGSTFTLSNLSYTSTENRNLTWSGKSVEECLNAGQPTIITSGCLISGRVPVKAVAPGTSYNIAASNTGWSTTAPVGAYTDNAMAGGTDKTITVVTQADVDKVVATIKTGDKAVAKNNLIESIKESSNDSSTVFIIESSYKQTVSDPEVSPKVGEEVKEGTKPSLTVTVTDSIYIIDETKVREFITEKAKLANDYKIYQIGDENKEYGGLFIENFMKENDKYTGKLKTTYISGPSVTENDIIEMVRGKGIGTAKHDIAENSGIKDVSITPSYPWVSSVPNDPEKITVNFEKLEQ
ncbi:hypothetical protein IJI89_01425 [Candidatus Saccharibacteria bacterium]|nr:hypothetical protein [Candidatus Saccharibacteria bacterium]